MAHEWHRGILDKSSWHGLEEVGVMVGADGMIAAADRTGAWPTAIRREPLFTANGVKARNGAIVADYQQHETAVLGIVGGRYRATTPDEWRELVRAAVEAGGRPTGAFALANGTRALATFEVGAANGLRTNLIIVDSFDGSLGLRCGTTEIRTVCWNTMTAAFRKDGGGMASIRHTASLEQKVAALGESIGKAIATGQKVRETYARARDAKLSRRTAQAAFDLLFPVAPEGSSKATVTRAENARHDAQVAATMAINFEGPTLATVWNAATYLVDRNADGSPRETRSGNKLDNLLFGTRAERIQEIQTIIEVVLRDGTVEPMTVHRALDHGIDPRAIGRRVIEDLMSDVA